MKACIIILFVLVTTLWANEFSESKIESFRKSALAEHNRLRALHGAPKLTLDLDLNNLAELHAIKSCQSIKTRQPTYNGNLLGINKITYEGSRRFSGKQFTKHLYSTGKNFDYTSGVLVGKPTTFTQLIWKSTSKIGIGICKIKDKMDIVAFYYPIGNVLKALLQNVNPPIASKKKAQSSTQIPSTTRILDSTDDGAFDLEIYEPKIVQQKLTSLLKQSTTNKPVSSTLQNIRTTTKFQLPDESDYVDFRNPYQPFTTTDTTTSYDDDMQELKISSDQLLTVESQIFDGNKTPIHNKITFR